MDRAVCNRQPKRATIHAIRQSAQPKKGQACHALPSQHTQKVHAVPVPSMTSTRRATGGWIWLDRYLIVDVVHVEIGARASNGARGWVECSAGSCGPQWSAQLRDISRADSKAHPRHSALAGGSTGRRTTRGRSTALPRPPAPRTGAARAPQSTCPRRPRSARRPPPRLLHRRRGWSSLPEARGPRASRRSRTCRCKQRRRGAVSSGKRGVGKNACEAERGMAARGESAHAFKGQRCQRKARGREARACVLDDRAGRDGLALGNLLQRHLLTRESRWRLEVVSKQQAQEAQGISERTQCGSTDRCCGRLGCGGGGRQAEQPTCT